MKSPFDLLDRTLTWEIKKCSFTDVTNLHQIRACHAPVPKHSHHHHLALIPTSEEDGSDFLLSFPEVDFIIPSCIRLYKWSPVVGGLETLNSVSYMGAGRHMSGKSPPNTHIYTHARKPIGTEHSPVWLFLQFTLVLYSCCTKLFFRQPEECLWILCLSSVSRCRVSLGGI